MVELFKDSREILCLRGGRVEQGKLLPMPSALNPIGRRYLLINWVASVLSWWRFSRRHITGAMGRAVPNIVRKPGGNEMGRKSFAGNR